LIYSSIIFSIENISNGGNTENTLFPLFRKGNSYFSLQLIVSPAAHVRVGLEAGAIERFGQEPVACTHINTLTRRGGAR
jgi:hypothetical protein